jgi:hypothetical protein
MHKYHVCICTTHSIPEVLAVADGEAEKAGKEGRGARRRGRKKLAQQVTNHSNMSQVAANSAQFTLSTSDAAAAVTVDLSLNFGV